MGATETLQLPICDHVPQPHDGPTRDEALAMRHQNVNPGVLTYYRVRLMIVEGNRDIVGIRNGYHGGTSMTMGLTSPGTSAPMMRTTFWR